jgi:hypothetical protein
MSESQNGTPTSDRSTKNAGVKVDPAYVKTFIENIFTSYPFTEGWAGAWECGFLQGGRDRLR